MIEAIGLTRYYGSFAALQDASFTIDDHEIVGLLGLNGAGKSTALKLLAGILLPTAGRVTVGGIDGTTDPDRLRRTIGFLPDDPPLYHEMRVREFLRWCGEIKGRTRTEVDQAMPEVLNICDLEDVAQRIIGELSHGYKKRVGIAQAIIHRPQVVILDEPISGLDPQQIVEMRRVVRRLKEYATVLISSHILSEIEQTCDRILVIHRGRLMFEGSGEDLASHQGPAGRLAMVVRGDKSTLAQVLDDAPGVEHYEIFDERRGQDHRLSLQLRDDDRPALVRALVEAELGLRELNEARSELENVFLQLTGGPDPAVARTESESP